MTMPDEGGAGATASGIMGGKILGIPSIVWVGGIALIVYFLFFRNSSSGTSSSSGGSAGTPTGGSGTITTGATTIDSGAVQVSVSGANSSPQAAVGSAQSGTGASTAQNQPNPPTTGTSTTASTGDLPAPTSHSDTPYNNFVDLGWGPVTGAEEYHYQVLQGSKVVADALTSATSVRVPNLSPNTGYKWRVSVGQPRGLWTGFTNFTTKAS